jgi:hypothetical protein
MDNVNYAAGAIYNNDDPYQAFRTQTNNELIQPYDPSTNSDPLATSVLGVAT